MSLFEHQRHESTTAPQSLPQDTVEIVDLDGNRLRFARSDFQELYKTSDARQMRRHLRDGWLLLDEHARRDGEPSAPRIYTPLHRRGGHVLAAQDDPQYLPQEDVTTYVLGMLKAGASGTPVK